MPNPRLLAQSSRDLVLHPGRKVPLGSILTSVKQLKEHIDAFIEAYNPQSHALPWTKAVVHQRRFKDRRISQL